MRTAALDPCFLLRFPRPQCPGFGGLALSAPFYLSFRNPASCLLRPWVLDHAPGSGVRGARRKSKLGELGETPKMPAWFVQPWALRLQERIRQRLPGRAERVEPRGPGRGHSAHLSYDLQTLGHPLRSCPRRGGGGCQEPELSPPAPVTQAHTHAHARTCTRAHTRTLTATVTVLPEAHPHPYPFCQCLIV